MPQSCVCVCASDLLNIGFDIEYDRLKAPIERRQPGRKFVRTREVWGDAALGVGNMPRAIRLTICQGPKHTRRLLAIAPFQTYFRAASKASSTAPTTPIALSKHLCNEI